MPSIKSKVSMTSNTSTGHVDIPIVGEYVCYGLMSHNMKRTYVGSTNNLHRRIRQHNREITGGARATAGFRPCKLLFVVKGFGRDRRSALRMEWHMKQHPNWCKHVRCIRDPLQRRRELLDRALSWANDHLDTTLTVEHTIWTP